MKDEELQFIEDIKCLQLLLNKEYINYLIDLGLFKEENFLLYMKYLRYFHRNEYITSIIYPDCLIILEKLIILLESHFKGEIKYYEMIHEIKETANKVDNQMKYLHRI
ncbi:Mediator of RNA polymerase II transcription subunit 31 [Cucumispora dikerogammari]|nr:Mediator of RNA polymerase II transcription subunit 31 [Cucumispora dikerogammari]